MMGGGRSLARSIARSTTRSRSTTPSSVSTNTNSSQYNSIPVGSDSGGYSRSSSLSNDLDRIEQEIKVLTVMSSVPQGPDAANDASGSSSSASGPANVVDTPVEPISTAPKDFQPNGRSLSEERRSSLSTPRSDVIQGRSSSACSAPGSNFSSKSTNQSRGRDFTRNRDLHASRKSARSTSSNASTSIPITRTPNISEQDVKFEQLRLTPDDNRREWNRRFPEGHLIIYTDGSAIANGSGFGIYMGPNHPLNRSERINGPPHDSARAEILAAIQSLRNLREWEGYNDEPVIVRTDALLIVYAMEGKCGGPPWYTREKAKYPSELKELREICEEFEKGVKFEHVYAHTEDPGNEAADDLARQATVGPLRSRSMSRNRDGNPQRMRSKNNDPYHIRSHSAHVIGRKKRM